MSSVDRVCMVPLYALVGYLPVSLSCMFGTASSLNLPMFYFPGIGINRTLLIQSAVFGCRKF